MARSSRRPFPPLIEELLAEGAGFEFLQAIRILESASLSNGVSTRAHVGLDAMPSQEVVRLRASPGLSYHVGEILDVRAPDSVGDPYELRATFMGLVGPSGVLPDSYTEHVLARLQQRDPALREFLDVLHHRTLSLFVRALRKYRFPFQNEEARARGVEDDVTLTLSALTGLGIQGLRDKLPLADHVFYFYAGHFARVQRTGTGLQSILSDHFGTPVRVESFVGRWLDIPEAELSRLGGTRDHDRLGGGFTLGARVWDVTSKIRVRLGPVDWLQFARLQPGSKGFAELRAILSQYAGPGLDEEVVVEIDPRSVPPLQLTSSLGARLGATAFLTGSKPTAAPVEAVFQIAG